MLLKKNKTDNDSLIRSQILNDASWREIFCSISSNYSVFQSPDWINCMERCTKSGVAKVFHFEFADGSQVFWPFLQYPMGRVFTSFTAMPFGVYGKPIVIGRWSPKKGGEILHMIMRGWNMQLTYVENPLDERIDFLLPAGITLEVRKCETHILELAPSWDVMWLNTFTNRIRRQVRVAEKSGLTIRPGFTNHDIEEFYRLYQLESKEWGYEKSPYSLQFFLDLLNSSCNNIKLLLAEEQARVIAGMIYVEDNNSLLCWFGTKDKTIEDKFPTYYLFSHVIHEAIKQEKKFLNLGASGNLEGVRRFKEMWHAKPVSYNVLIFRRQSAINSIEKVSALYHYLFRKGNG